LSSFNAQQKLKQATYTFIVSQLLTKQEKEKIDSIFRSMDTDGDGTLTRDEIKAGYSEHFGQHMSDEEIDRIFCSVDSDLSGEIDYTEFVAATMNQRNLLSQKRLESAFKAFDKDGNGQISPEEVRILLGGGAALDEKTVAKIIAQVDEDGDGQVSFTEFCEMMSKNIL
jgi:calcium-dependent protein kinase